MSEFKIYANRLYFVAVDQVIFCMPLQSRLLISSRSKKNWLTLAKWWAQTTKTRQIGVQLLVIRWSEGLQCGHPWPIASNAEWTINTQRLMKLYALFPRAITQPINKKSKIGQRYAIRGLLSRKWTTAHTLECRCSHTTILASIICSHKIMAISPENVAEMQGRSSDPTSHLITESTINAQILKMYEIQADFAANDHHLFQCPLETRLQSRLRWKWHWLVLCQTYQVTSHHHKTGQHSWQISFQKNALLKAHLIFQIPLTIPTLYTPTTQAQSSTCVKTGQTLLAVWRVIIFLVSILPSPSPWMFRQDAVWDYLDFLDLDSKLRNKKGFTFFVGHQGFPLEHTCNQKTRHKKQLAGRGNWMSSDFFTATSGCTNRRGNLVT